jgi:hypothetical protein
MGRNPYALGMLSFASAKVGQIDKARKLLDELHELVLRTYVQPANISFIYFGMGEINKCFDWPENALEESVGYLNHINVEPLNHPLHSHPRYRALVRKMNLEP